MSKGLTKMLTITESETKVERIYSGGSRWPFS